MWHIFPRTPPARVWCACTCILWWLSGAAAQSTSTQEVVVCRSAPTTSGAPAIVVGASAALDCCSTNAPFGRQHVRAWQLFTNWVSQRGGVLVNGTRRPLEVRVLNDRSSTSDIKTAYQKHAKDGVSLFVGPFGTPGTLQAATVANASGALLLCPRASDIAVTAGRPTVWSVTPPAAKYATCAFEALQLHRPRTVAWIAENSSAQLSWCQPLAEQLPNYGMNLTYSEVMPAVPNQTTIRGALGRLRAASVDVVFACMALQGCTDVAIAMEAVSYYPGAMVLPACTTGQDWQNLGETGLFHIGTTPWMPSMPLTSALTGWTAAEFASYYQSAFGQEPPFQAAAAFATLEILVTAIEQTGSTDVGTIVDKLKKNFELATVYGKLRFDSNRQLVLDFQAIQEQRVGSNPLVVSPLAFAQAPLRYPMPHGVERRCFSTAASGFGYTSPGVCEECPPGYTSVWNATAGERWCFYCPPGFVLHGSSNCTACPAGTITIAAGQDQCAKCPAGTFAAGEGQSRCLACLTGKFGPEVGATACAACAPGRFNDQAEQTICQNCPAGTSVAEPAALACSPCGDGTYADADGAASCTVCSGGRITAQVGARNASSCICARGSYSDGGACAQCPPLQSTDDNGAASRSACALTSAGRTVIAVVVSAAVACPAMFWAVLERMRKRVREAERLHLRALQKQLDDGLQTIQEFQHPMVVVPAAKFLQMTDEDLQAAHEHARERGMLKVFNRCSEVAEHRQKHPACKIILFSYEWLSYDHKGPSSMQAARMRRALALFCERTDTVDSDVLVWLDVLSIPQVNAAVKVLAVNSLYTYAAAVDALIVVAPATVHEGTGERADLESYKKRVWTRMEIVAQVAAHGLDSVFISTEADLVPATASLVEEVVEIFKGNMTCCRLKHKGRHTCDKEALVLPMLGVWYLLSGGAGAPSNMGAVLLYGIMQARLADVFPTHFAFDTEFGTEQRELFGGLIPLLEKHLKRPRSLLHQVSVSLQPTVSQSSLKLVSSELRQQSPEDDDGWGPEILAV